MDFANSNESENRPLRLLIVIASTRPGRVGLPVGEWFRDEAIRHGGFEVTVADLAELNLPLMDEPNHPRLGLYTHQHTKEWSALVDAADAFVFITPEYNYAMTAPLKNAIDYLSREWQYKPVGFVSYGGISGGLRAVQMVKQVVTTLKMVPLPEGVVLNFPAQHLDEERRFKPSDAVLAAVPVMLNELARWAATLRQMRVPAPAAATR